MYSGKKGEFKVLVVLALVIVLFGLWFLEGGITGMVVGTEIGARGLGIMAIPVVSNVVLNSSDGTNLTTENLTLYWDATDNTSKNITNWKLNGTSIAVLNMPFENASGNQSGDYSGFENNGTTNTATWNATGGFDGKGAFEFDGEDDYINVGSVPSGMEDVTVSLWVSSSGNNRYSLNIFESASMAWAVSGSSGHVAIYDDIGNAGATRYSTVTSGWTHVVAQLLNNGDSTCENRLYLNGVLEGSGEDSLGCLTNVSGNMYIGTRYPSFITYFNGTIDDVLIFNRSLSADQIQAIYNNRTDLLSSDETSVNDNWSARITPNDGTEDGITSESTNLIILGYLLLSTPSITPTTAYTNNTLTVNTFNHADTPVTAYFEWYKNSINIYNYSVSAGASSMVTSTLNSTNFSTNDIINVSVYADNATDNSSTVWSNTVTIVSFPLVNLISNPNFDDNLTSWSHSVTPTGSSGTATIVDTGCLSGNCIELNHGNSTWQGVTQSVGTLNGNTTYLLSVYFNTTSAHYGRINLHDYTWKNSACVRAGKSYTSYLTGNNSWRKMNRFVFLPEQDDCNENTANHTWEVYFYGEIPTSNNDSVYYDNFSLTTYEPTFPTISLDIEEDTEKRSTKCKLYSDTTTYVPCNNAFQFDNSTNISGNYSLKFTGVRENEIIYSLKLPIENFSNYRMGVSIKIANRTVYNYLNLSDYPSSFLTQTDGVREIVDQTKGVWSGRYLINIDDRNMLIAAIKDMPYRSHSDLDWFNDESYFSTTDEQFVDVDIVLQGFEGNLYIDNLTLEKVDSFIDDKTLNFSINTTFQGMNLTDVSSSPPVYVTTNAANFSFENDNILMMYKNEFFVGNITFPQDFLTGLVVSEGTGFALVENSNVSFSVGADSTVLVKIKQNITVSVESSIATNGSGYYSYQAGNIFATDYTNGIFFSPILPKQTIQSMPYTYDASINNYSYYDSDLESEGLKNWDKINDFSEASWKINYTFDEGDGFIAEVFPPKEFNTTKYCKDRPLQIDVDFNMYPNGSFDYVINKFLEHHNIALVWMDEFLISENNMNPPDYYYTNSSNLYTHPNDPNATATTITTKFDPYGPYNVTEKDTLSRFVNESHSKGLEVIIYMGPTYYYTSNVDVLIDNLITLINEFDLDGVYFDEVYQYEPLKSLEISRKVRNNLGDKFYWLHASWAYSTIRKSNQFRVPVFDSYADAILTGESRMSVDGDIWRLDYCGQNVSNTITVLSGIPRSVNHSAPYDSTHSLSLSLSPEEQINKSLNYSGIFRTSIMTEESLIIDSFFSTSIYYDSDLFFDSYDAFCLPYTCGDGVCDPGETLNTCMEDCAPDTSDIVNKIGNQYYCNGSNSVAQWVVDGEPFYKLRFTFDDSLAKDDSGNKMSPHQNVGVIYDPPEKKTVDGNSAFEFNGSVDLYGIVDNTLNLSNRNFSLFMNIKPITMNSSYQILFSLHELLRVVINNNLFTVDLINSSASTQRTTGSILIDNNTWHTVGLIYEDPNLSLYVDGTKDKEIVYDIGTFTDYPTYYFGEYSTTIKTFNFNGYIDDFFITDTVLTDQQIIEYNNSLHKNFTIVTDDIACITTNGSNYFSVSTVCGNNRCETLETITNCQVDCDKDNDNMDDRSDPLVGNESHVSNNLNNLTLEVNASTNITQNFTSRLKLQFKENNITKLEFYFNFSSHQLNLSDINITKQSTGSSIGSLEISGLDLTSQSENKTVYVDKIASHNRLCIKDSSSAIVSGISSSCNAVNETSIACPGTSGQYTCSLNGTKYKLEGLNHSAVKEYSPTVTESPGGGGSSSSTSLICQIGAIKCISSLQYQECLDYGTTNKWSDDLDVAEGYQCQFGKIVEIEEVTKVAEETEETQPTLPKSKEESKETKPKTSFYQTIKSLTWLWLTLIIIIITGIIIYLLKKKR